MRLIKEYAGFPHYTDDFRHRIKRKSNERRYVFYVIFCSKDMTSNVNLSTCLTFHNAIIQKQNTVLADEIGTSNQATLCFVD